MKRDDFSLESVFFMNESDHEAQWMPGLDNEDTGT